MGHHSSTKVELELRAARTVLTALATKKCSDSLPWSAGSIALTPMTDVYGGTAYSDYDAHAISSTAALPSTRSSVAEGDYGRRGAQMPDKTACLLFASHRNNLRSFRRWLHTTLTPMYLTLGRAARKMQNPPEGTVHFWLYTMHPCSMPVSLHYPDRIFRLANDIQVVCRGQTAGVARLWPHVIPCPFSALLPKQACIWIRQSWLQDPRTPPLVHFPAFSHRLVSWQNGQGYEEHNVGILTVRKPPCPCPNASAHQEAERHIPSAASIRPCHIFFGRPAV